MINASPDLENFRETMNNEIQQAQRDFDEKSKTMNDQQKQEYNNQLRERLALKEQELRAPILSKIEAAVKLLPLEKELR